MTQRLAHLTLSAPGRFGLRKQESGDVLPPGWATEALNCVIDDLGRLAARKGYQRQHTTALNGTVQSAIEYIESPTSSTTVVGAGTALYKIDGATVTTITGTATAPTLPNWKFQNFNGKLVGWQDSHNAVVLSSVAGTFADIVAGSGSVPSGNEVLSAFGRLFVLDGTTLTWCGLLDETDWGGAGAGSLDLNNVWESGKDVGIALAEFNGFLIIFGKKQIVIFQGAEDPNAATFVKREVIKNVGCIARDSVQSIDEDLLFLSQSGVRSLGREIEGNLPTSDLSKNVRDYLIEKVNSDDVSTIKSVYSEDLGFYLITASDRTFLLDTRARLDDGALRVTEWDFVPDSFTTVGSDLFFGSTGNYFSKYTGFKDDVVSDGTGGNTYEWNFEGPWDDFRDQSPPNQSIDNLIKFPKNGTINIFGGQGYTLQFKWAFDFDDTFNSINMVVPSGNASEWNVFEWGIDEWSGGALFNQIKRPLSRSGRIIKIGLQTTIDGNALALHRVHLLVKLGKQIV